MTQSKLTDMDVVNMSTTDVPIDNEPQFETLPETSIATPIIEMEKTQTALIELADRVDTVRDQPSLEAYQWSYQALTGINNVVETKSISLEGFTGTVTRKHALAKAIRNEVTKLDTELNLALESYADDIKEDFGSIIKEYEQLNRKLRATDSDIENTVSTKIDINHTRVFDMFMVKDVFKGKEPIQVIRAETTNLERLVARVATGIARITKDIESLEKDTKLDRSSRDLPEQNNVHLMFNRTVKIEQGQFESDQRKTRLPKKSYSWGQHFWIIFGAVMFKRLGYQLAKLVNGEKKDSEAKVTNSLGDVHKFIRAVEGLEDIVDELSGHVQTLTTLFTKVDETNESALNRRIVPLMELSMFIMKQVCDITNGTDKLFTKIVRKATK